VYVSSAGGTNRDVFVISEQPNNIPPNCVGAHASESSLWPPNHMMNKITILSITDHDKDSITIRITGIHQGERTKAKPGDPSPDGTGIGTDTDGTGTDIET
jgi:hypothetical protein